MLSDHFQHLAEMEEAIRSPVCHILLFGCAMAGDRVRPFSAFP
jgi:hypothetical protein